MRKDDQVYTNLQKHLDRQAVGFPATASGAEIKILKHIFSPGEAEIATFLSFRFESLDVLFRRASGLVSSREELEQRLEHILEKGGIESKIVAGERFYCNSPLIVGMYEGQLDRLTPEFIRNFREYTSDRNFGLDFLGTELPQMRTIPVSRSIRTQHNISTYDEVTSLLEQAEGPFVIMKCICRDKKSMEGFSCKMTEREDTCLGVGGSAQAVLLGGRGREISREEALDILFKNEKEGLVLQPSNTEKAEFICSCCGCCCGMLGIQKALPRPMEFWSSNYFAAVNQDLCDGCGTCVSRCQVNAVSVEARSKPAVVDLDRCLGCGLCVTTCMKKAITLVKKPVEGRPPETREELYEILFSKRKGKIGRIKLAGKLLFDSLRAGDYRLLQKK
jgi:H+/Na+-translocating ferredoxin:NAD+ oxidoreductase subunit B